MIKYSKAELIDMIDNYSDTSAIIGQLREVKWSLTSLNVLMINCISCKRR